MLMVYACWTHYIQSQVYDQLKTINIYDFNLVSTKRRISTNKVKILKWAINEKHKVFS